MRRRVFNLATILSLVLLVATVTLGVLSYYVVDRITSSQTTTSRAEVVSAYDGVSLARYQSNSAGGYNLTSSVLLLPCLPAAALAGVLPVMWLVRFCRRPPKPGTCASCGYNLTGNVSGVCPECGSRVAA